jgi:hypothetical protein
LEIKIYAEKSDGDKLSTTTCIKSKKQCKRDPGATFHALYCSTNQTDYQSKNQDALERGGHQQVPLPAFEIDIRIRISKELLENTTAICKHFEKMGYANTFCARPTKLCHEHAKSGI